MPWAFLCLFCYNRFLSEPSHAGIMSDFNRLHETSKKNWMKIDVINQKVVSLHIGRKE